MRDSRQNNTSKLVRKVRLGESAVGLFLKKFVNNHINEKVLSRALHWYGYS